MKTESRTDKAVRNTMVSLACQMLYLLLSFICRTVFTNMLGAEYLGISGLFSNLLTLLSFAELGIGSALVYRMYAPLAEHDYKKVCQYMRLYRDVYRVILLIIVLLGLLFIPFLPLLVQAPDVKENLTALYGLYLCQTAASYVCVYKKSLFIADQRNYIVDIYTQIWNIIMNGIQCILLVLTRSFTLYCITSIACILANNIVCARRTDREYPYLNRGAAVALSKEEIRGLAADVKGLLLTKIASMAFSGTDNLFISAFVGIKYVGILSNYSLILTTVNGVINKVFDAVTASVGNLLVSGPKSQVESVLKKMFFLCVGLYGYICMGMMFLLKEFVTEFWFTNEYALSDTVIYLILIEMFFRSIHYPIYTVRNAMGAFSQYKVIFAAAALLNIILDFVFVKPFGIAGLTAATILCRGITYLADIYVVYCTELKISLWNYLKPGMIWMLFLIVCGFLLSGLLSMIQAAGGMGFVLKVLVITGVYWGMFLAVFGDSGEFRYYYQLICGITGRKGSGL
ncbi:MAG: oligosaccharide flippase family protein [Clostridium sp.]|jgi:O-antigen/teichoic acid export membrane protein|nr:oligosaccharide flippase family protein [Clostridium sp.]